MPEAARVRNPKIGLRSMKRAHPTPRGYKSIIWAALATTVCGAANDPTTRSSTFEVKLDSGHKWIAPFGLDRIGRPVVAVVESKSRPEPANYALTAYWKGKEVGRYPLDSRIVPPTRPRFRLRAMFSLINSSSPPFSKDNTDVAKPVELARQTIQPSRTRGRRDRPARRGHQPRRSGHDPGPFGLAAPRSGAVGNARRSPRSAGGADLPKAQLNTSFDSCRRTVASTPSISPRAAGSASTQAPRCSAGRRARCLSVVLEDGWRPQLWRKTIPVMLVAESPARPRFGATYERLRYDAPISVREPGTGKFSSMPYEEAGSPSCDDVVVWLPNGARFVFWRGSSYIPFWAGRHNTGACYEWAEIISQPQGAVDCVEPLMDKELRYSRVEIVESTTARVHVRWSYQSTDFNYKVWGDAAVEDYYFYPDGFGTRVVNLKSDPKNDYELSEFIILTPTGCLSVRCLAGRPGRRPVSRRPEASLPFPESRRQDGSQQDRTRRRAGDLSPAARPRTRSSRPIYFNPNETKLPPVVFGPFFDGGEMVTPCYWGSHWPLARGNSTGRTIDDRIQFTPTATTA